jgi:hypothetical protein
MDDIEFMVAETFRHFRENYQSEGMEKPSPLDIPQENPKEDAHVPAGPGLLYHLQKSTSLFVVRTFVSHDLQTDYQKIIDYPENYPSLRLLEAGTNQLIEKLQYFPLEDYVQAEIIHDLISNRRFPIHEEMMCNLSDPGFSWWLSKKASGFQLSFTLSVNGDGETVKLGPIGDQQLATRNFQLLGNLLNEAGLNLNVENESNRVQFNNGEEFLLEEIKNLFEFGVVSEGLEDLFKLLARRIKDHSQLETLWFYLQEVAAMRRFWIQIEYNLVEA